MSAAGVRGVLPDHGADPIRARSTRRCWPRWRGSRRRRRRWRTMSACFRICASSRSPSRRSRSALRRCPTSATPCGRSASARVARHVIALAADPRAHGGDAMAGADAGRLGEQAARGAGRLHGDGRGPGAGGKRRVGAAGVNEGVGRGESGGAPAVHGHGRA